MSLIFLHAELLRFDGRALAADPVHVPLREQARPQHAALAAGARTALQHRDEWASG